MNQKIVSLKHLTRWFWSIAKVRNHCHKKKELCHKRNENTAVINPFERACSRRHKKSPVDLSRWSRRSLQLQRSSWWEAWRLGPKDLASNESRRPTVSVTQRNSEGSDIKKLPLGNQGPSSSCLLIMPSISNPILLLVDTQSIIVK